MVRFGIIGTNFITETFLEAAGLCPEFRLEAVYSRTLERGREFGERYGVQNIFTDLDEMIESGKIDAIYIASPTSLHHEHTLKFLKKGIGVLCEKPLGSNLREVREMVETSEREGVLLMEAIRTLHNPNYEVIRKNLGRIGKVRGVYGNFCQYSSRYDRFREGEVLNAFLPQFSNGSTMDIGLYPFYFVLGLFGKPEGIASYGTVLSSGVDGAGTALLKYPGMVATVNHSKINNSSLPSEITGEEGVITIEKIATLEKITLKLRNGEQEELTVEREKNDMYYEIREFLDCYGRSEVESRNNPHSNSLLVAQIMENARKDIGVVFPADKA
ncbi:MAG: Gfo/Idh/MocA family protein [Fusobacteriaceae bacterium]